MVRACREADSLLVINHNRRFNPNYRRLRDLIAAGGLGELPSITVQWGAGRLGNIGTHMFDAIYMVTGRRVEAVSGTLDLAGRSDCRGPQFHDPGGWGTMRLEGGLMVVVDAPDYGRTPPTISVNGSEGRALTGGDEVRIERWDDRQEHWPSQRQKATAMDRAVEEIAAWLDHGTPFPYAAEEAVHILEAIAAFHASHARNATRVELPLTGADRDIEIRSG